MAERAEISKRRDQPVFVLDGAAFDDFAEFQRLFTAFLDDYTWTGSLDAFNDILRGGFGTPDQGWIWRWVNVEDARRALGYAATTERLETILQRCHALNRQAVRERLEAARRGEGPALFDEIVEIIKVHGPAGAEAADGIVLEFQ